MNESFDAAERGFAADKGQGGGDGRGFGDAAWRLGRLGSSGDLCFRPLEETPWLLRAAGCGVGTSKEKILARNLGIGAAVGCL